MRPPFHKERPPYPGHWPVPAAPAVSAPAALGLFAGFSLVVLAMGFNGTVVLTLPVVALVGVLVTREWDDFGLVFWALITLSFSYYYGVWQIGGLLTVMRFFLLGLLLVAALKALSRGVEYASSAVLFLLFFLFALVGSFFFSAYRDIAAMKALFAGAFFLGLILSAGSSGRFPYALFASMTAVAVLSVALFFINPLIGYSYTLDPNSAATAMGRYAGVLNHPQLLACLLAVNIPLFLHVFVTRRGLLSMMAFLALLCTLFINVISSSRTGMLATIVASVTALWLFSRAATDETAVRRLRGVLALVILAVLVAGLSLSDQVAEFIRKSDDVYGGISLSGREEIIFASWRGFLDQPLLGHGFQVPSPFTEHGGASFGMTSESTSVEKCFFLTMLLEEVGLFGTALFLAGVLMLYRRWFRKGAYVSVAAMTGFLMANVGEACILSPSSLGGLCWLSVFAAHNLVFDEAPSPR